MFKRKLLFICFAYCFFITRSFAFVAGGTGSGSSGASATVPFGSPFSLYIFLIICGFLIHRHRK